MSYLQAHHQIDSMKWLDFILQSAYEITPPIQENKLYINAEYLEL